MSLFRYAGSKKKLLKKIIDRFPDQFHLELWSDRLRWEYREPFFGSGAIGLEVLKTLAPHCRVWLNDIDPNLAKLWQCVRDCPEGLIENIERSELSADDFYRFKEEDDIDDLPAALAGFQKLALQSLSHSGLGAMAGGPIGGKRQENKRYSALCRWNPSRKKEVIADLHSRLARFRNFQFTNLDFSALIDGAPRECLIYADPPYFVKGGQLYKYAMTEDDHIRLSNSLRNCKAFWVLSYDDHPFIRYLYSWARISLLDITYTVAVSDTPRRKNKEVLITPHQSDSH